MQITSLTREEGKQAFARLMTLPNPPDGVFSGIDTTALSALNYCHENSNSVIPFEQVVLPTQLIIRESSK